MFWEKLIRLMPAALYRAVEQKVYTDCVDKCMALSEELPDSERLFEEAKAIVRRETNAAPTRQHLIAVLVDSVSTEEQLQVAVGKLLTMRAALCDIEGLAAGMRAT